VDKYFYFPYLGTLYFFLVKFAHTNLMFAR
jgi:hypothetical protein